MVFQDVAFLPSQAGFLTTFLDNGGSLMTTTTTTCLITLIGDEQWHAPCRILSLQPCLFLCQMNFMENIRLSWI